MPSYFDHDAPDAENIFEAISGLTDAVSPMNHGNASDHGITVAGALNNIARAIVRLAAAVEDETKMLDGKLEPRMSPKGETGPR